MTKKSAEKKSFILYYDSIDIVEYLPDEEVGKLFKAIFLYVNGKEVPPLPTGAAVAYMGMVKQIDRDTIAYMGKCAVNQQNGHLGGRPPKTERLIEEPKITERFISITENNPTITEPNPTEPKITLTDTDTDTETDTEPDTVNETEPVSDTKRKGTHTPKKQKYGSYDNVKLTADDLDKLQEEFPNDWDSRIERLSEYIAIKGDKYKNHLAVIRSWAKKDTAQPNNGYPQKAYAPQYNSNPFTQLLKEMEQEAGNTFYQEMSEEKTDEQN